MATPLHNHTHASQLDGLAKPSEIVERSKQINVEAVGCTDHDLVAGHVEFYKTLTKEGVKPVLGIETYQTIGPRTENFGGQSQKTADGGKEKIDNFHLILLAQSNEGLKNLYRMNSEAHATGFYYHGRVDWDLLERYNEGIIATSACGLGLISQALRNNPFIPDVDTLMARYLDIFGDRFYLELSTYSEKWQRDLNYMISKLGQDYGVPLVYANDAHYAFPQQYELHETILCMQYNEKVKDREEPHHTPDLYIMSEKEVREAFYYLPTSMVDEAIDSSDEIARLSKVSMPAFKMHLPAFIPDGRFQSSKDMFFELCVQGYEDKIVARGLDSDVYMSRFRMEMEVMFQANLYNYLLIVRDMIFEERRQGTLVGPGRGSVGGSLLAYLIGIHELDPIKYGLIFERFYNIGRETSMPDIDVDFPTFRTEVVREYLANKYGDENCADIGTVSTLQARAAIQKIGKTLDIPYTDTKAISDFIEKQIKSGQQPKWEAIDAAIDDDMNMVHMRHKHSKLFEYARTMHGRTFTYGGHASGFIVSDVPLAENFPLRWNTKKKKVVTQWDMRIAEELGFIKVDILGVRNLDTLMEYNRVLSKQNKAFVDFYDIKRMDEDGELPEDMWKLLDDGLTVGVFQVEDGVMAKWLGRHLKCRNLEDLALLTALNRPAVLKAQAHEKVVDGRNGNPHPALHPLLEDVCAESYGQLIYQEQFINFFVALGYDPKEADSIRAIVGKKKRKEMAEAKPEYMKRFMNHPETIKYVNKLIADNSTVAGQPSSGDVYMLVEKHANIVWDALEGFADYAFNKAHSVEYGLISLWTLYAKYSNPIEYYLASIRSLVAEGEKGEVPRYVREAPRMGIDVLPVDMNKSEAETSIQGNAIRYGFLDIKGIGKSAAEWLVAHRPFANFNDIVTEAEKEENKVVLRNGTTRMAVNRGHVGKLERLTTSEGEDLFDVEEELLGYSISDDSATILDEYASEIAQECVPFSALDEPGDYTVAGIITNIRETKTKKGDPMAWVTLKAADGEEIECTVWSDKLKALSFVWRRRQAVVALVKANTRGKNIVSAKPLYKK